MRIGICYFVNPGIVKQFERSLIRIHLGLSVSYFAFLVLYYLETVLDIFRQFRNTAFGNVLS